MILNENFINKRGKIDRVKMENLTDNLMTIERRVEIFEDGIDRIKKITEQAGGKKPYIERIEAVVQLRQTALDRWLLL